MKTGFMAPRAQKKNFYFLKQFSVVEADMSLGKRPSRDALGMNFKFVAFGHNSLFYYFINEIYLP